MPTTVTRALADDGATAALGAALAAHLRPGLVIHLCGALGVGKTTLARGLLRALGERGRVRSPTFTLLETYDAGGFEIVHLDLYRLEQPEELLHAGFNEYLDGRAVLLIEWPECGAPLLPLPDLEIALSVQGTGRRAVITAHSPLARAVLPRL